MKIEKLRKLAGREEIDYQFLISALKEFASPRDKISAWIKSGELIRVKKGLYIFGKEVALQAYSKEVLANLVYGPSAISLTYALSYYGFIPEKVHMVTSVSNNRAKTFSTPIGEFTYYYLNPKKYAVGIGLLSPDEQQSLLIASPEKALCDQIHIIDKTLSFKNIADLEKYLLDDLRVDEDLLLAIRLKLLKEICNAYGDARLVLLYDYIRNRR